MWYDCKDCIFATNSKKEAGRHIYDTGHDIKVEKEGE